MTFGILVLRFLGLVFAFLLVTSTAMLCALAFMSTNGQHLLNILHWVIDNGLYVASVSAVLTTAVFVFSWLAVFAPGRPRRIVFADSSVGSTS